MKKKILLIAIIQVLFFAEKTYSQITFQKNYGGYWDNSVQQTIDGGYIFASGHKTNAVDFYLVKTGVFGDTLWTKIYGSWYDEYPWLVRQTSDTGYILSGCIGTSANMDIYLIKTDSNGDTLWNKIYGSSDFDYGMAQELSGGGFIIYGEILVCDGCYADDVTLIKTNSMGDTLWSKRYNNYGWDDRVTSLAQTNDGGFILCCHYHDPAPVGYSQKGYLLKTDSDGNILWSKYYGANYDCGFSAMQTIDGGYIIAGNTRNYSSSSDVLLIKTDSIGNVLWSKIYGGTGWDDAEDVKQTTDGGYIITGSTQSFGAGQSDVYIIKINGNGDTLWTRTFGSGGWEWATSVSQTNDGGYVISASTSSNGNYIIKTDSNGNGGCYQGGSTTNSNPVTITSLNNSITIEPYVITVSSFAAPISSGSSINTLCTSQFINSSLTTTACDSMVSPSGKYTWLASGIYYDTVPSIPNFYIVYTIHLTVNQSTYSSISMSACDSFISPSGKYVWSTTGIYVETIPNSNGCDSVITVNLTILNDSYSAFTITSCDQYTSPGGNIWTSSGTYLDTIPNTVGCDSIITISLMINTVDTSVTVNGPNLFANSSGAAYQWMFCDSTLIVGATSQSYIPNASGSYSVIVFQNGCIDTSSCYLITDAGVFENNQQIFLNVFPDPAGNYITIECSRCAGLKGSLYISDVYGRILYSLNSFEPGRNNITIPIEVSQFAPGIYLINLYAKQSIARVKFVKE